MVCGTTLAGSACPIRSMSILDTSLVVCTRLNTIPKRSEEHTSELQSLMRISYAVFCLKKKIQIHHHLQTLTTKSTTFHYKTLIFHKHSTTHPPTTCSQQ